jgi:AbrB family transcriptional regulator (stage V sporulation protein T)
LKATGIVRRIDDLGRIVVPKEIRRTLRIHESDPMEIFTDSDGDIIFRKYSPMVNLGKFAKEYAEILANTSGLTVCIVDRESIIGISGAPKKYFLDKKISDNLESILNNRVVINASHSDNSFVLILDDERANETYNYELIVPIIAESDVVGAVVFLSMNTKMGDTENKLAKSAAELLAKQMS